MTASLIVSGAKYRCYDVIGLTLTRSLTAGQVGGKKVDWQSREGVLLSDGLRLSPAAQRFAIARELWHVRSSQVWQDGGIGAAALFATYLLGRALNKKLGFYERPRVRSAV